MEIDIERDAIALADILRALRVEINEAKKAAKNDDSNTRFNLNDIEIELQTVVTRNTGVETGAKCRFWVLDAEAKASADYTKALTQKVTFKLSPEFLKDDEDNNSGENLLSLGS